MLTLLKINDFFLKTTTINTQKEQVYTVNTIVKLLKTKLVLVKRDSVFL